MNNKDIKDLIDVIDNRSKPKQDMYVARVVTINNEYTYAGVRFPNSQQTFTFLNKSGEKLVVGDDVYVYAINGNLTSAYILTKLGVMGETAHRKLYTLTLKADSWKGSNPYTMQLECLGVKPEDTPHVFPKYSLSLSTRKQERSSWAQVSMVLPGKNMITFYCDEQKPTVDIVLQIEIIR